MKKDRYMDLLDDLEKVIRQQTKTIEIQQRTIDALADRLREAERKLEEPMLVCGADEPVEYRK